MFNFAHYWGIDEVGVFVVPAALALWALRRAERSRRESGDGDEKNEG
jgi:hypothetical protein